jgi:hypothetical protein
MRILLCAALLTAGACTSRENDMPMHAQAPTRVPPIDAAAAAVAFETATFATG